MRQSFHRRVSRRRVFRRRVSRWATPWSWRRPRWARPSLLLAALLLVLPWAPHWGPPWGVLRQAAAQLGQIGAAKGTPVAPNQPVTFIADTVEYDRERGLVTASGHVEAWQNEHVLRADKIVFDRNTNVVAATGHVVLLEPDGEVMFADYAELTRGMKDGVLRDMRALLAENGRLAANGARRTGGVLNELSRVVYSTCNLCEKDPSRPPLWQLRAMTAVQDTENKRIEYYDGELDMWGVPIAYLPYFSHPDPSVKRASGLLMPTMGASTHLGFFTALPYYWVIDDQSDLTITPMITAKAGQQLGLEYRRRFNNGEFTLDSSINDNGGRLEGAIFAHGRYNIDDGWRTGFDFSHASSPDYIRDFHLGRFGGGTAGVLPSQAYLEGFGQGAYLLLDSKMYQSVSTTIVNSRLPLVLPRFEYSYFGQVDPLGGRLAVDTNAFNVHRTDGADTRRAALTLNWDRPFTGMLGDLWKLTLHADSAAYDANDLHLQPDFFTHGQSNSARAQPQAALEVRWPFMRDAGAWGAQVIEPIAQVITAPNIGRSQLRNIPNEDSLDLEFSDANLFAFNRFPGLDRLEGGTRVNVGLRGAWILGGTALDGLIGQSYRTEKNTFYPPGSGLNGTVSDVVGRATFAPTDWLDMTYRTRLDHETMKVRMADALTSIGGPKLRVTAGYIYTTYDPYALYEAPPPPGPGTSYYFPRNEVTFGAASTWGNYHLTGFARRDLATNQMVAVGAVGAYEDECFIFDVRFQRRYTSVNNDHGATAILFQVTFKSVGQFGFRAM